LVKVRGGTAIPAPPEGELEAEKHNQGKYDQQRVRLDPVHVHGAGMEEEQSQGSRHTRGVQAPVGGGLFTSLGLVPNVLTPRDS